MNAGFCQFSAILACGPCTLLDGGYSLFYEKNGEGHLIEGIEDFKPYYLESGEKHSLTGASELVAKPNQSVSPSDFLYPLNYAIEKIAPVPDWIDEPLQYRVKIAIRDYRVPYGRSLRPSALLDHWSKERLEKGVLVLLWIADERLSILAAANLRGISNSRRFFRVLAGNVSEHTFGGFPALGLFDRGKSVAPRYPIENPAVLTAFLSSSTGSKRTIEQHLFTEDVLNFKDALRDSLLHCAASNGHADIVELLLASGINFNQRNKEGATPIISAAEHGRIAVVQALLAAGAKLKPRDHLGGNALHHAIRAGHEHVVSLLLDAGMSNTSVGFNGNTPISLAIANNRGRIVEKLSGLQARWRADRDDLDPFIVSKCAEGQKRIVRYLVARGARADRLVLGTTALIAAMRYGDEEMLDTLLMAGPDVGQPDTKGITPLITASSWDNKPAVGWLIKQGANVDYTSPSGVTAISAATRYHHPEVVRILLSNGADPNLADDKGFTPLEKATLFGDRTIVQDLIAAGGVCVSQ